jgi:hypothetical protein
MTQCFQHRSWFARVRMAMSRLFRRKHYALTDQPVRRKLVPIARTLADAGRDRGSPVD